MPSATGTASQRPILPITSRPAIAAPPRAISMLKLDLTDTDRYAFNYFIHNTYPDILIISPLKEWLAQAVQLSFDVAPVFYAITAVGCSHHSMPFVIDATLTRHYLDSHRAKGKLQYGKALTALRTLIGNASDSDKAIVPILLVCMLFGCFEVMEDRGQAAVAHMRYGRGIIADHYRQVKGSMRALAAKTGRTETPLDGQRLLSHRSVLLPDRLAETFIGMLDSDPVSEESRTLVDREEAPERLLSNGEVPTHFVSVAEARSHLDPLLEAAKGFRTQLLRLAENQINAMPGAPFSHAVTTCLSLCISRALPQRAHPAQYTLLAQLRKQFAAWTEALGPLLGSRDATIADSKALALMQIQHFTTNFVLSSIGQKSEDFTDAFRQEFVRILDLCEQYLHSTSIEATKKRQFQPAPAEPVQSGFSLEPRILPAMYLITHRCRHPAIRCRAINILRHSYRREGLFFSRVLCLSGDAYIEIEEGRVGAASVPITPASTKLSTPKSDDTSFHSMRDSARFSEALIAGSDVTGNDDRYFLDPIKTTPQGITLSPDDRISPFAEVLVAGNEGPPPSMTMWCGRFTEVGSVRGVEVVEFKGRGWPVHMEQMNSTFFAYD